MATRLPDEGARALNERMVESLFNPDGAPAEQIAHAFRSVLRHWFLPDTPLEEVYRDQAIVTRAGPHGPISSSSQPAIMARMLDQLDVRPGQCVLEIGAGTGYNAAVLAHLVGPAGSVTTVDLDPEITAEARAHLKVAGADNVTVITGDGWTGVPSHAPFDRIQATVGVWDIAPDWVDQLRPGGILLVPLWLRAGVQASVAFCKCDEHLVSRSVVPCGFMRLRGSGGGPESYHQIGSWTVCLDADDSATIDLVTELLRQEPSSQVAPPLEPGWFTAIALTEADAVNLFSLRDGKPVSRSGLLDRGTRTLAVIETDGLVGCGTTSTVYAFGGDDARSRLPGLIEHTPATDLTRLHIDATPILRAGTNNAAALARLVRRHYTFTVTVA